MKSEYERFRESLRINFATLDIEDKEELKKLMRVGGYRRYKDGTKYNPTQKQLIFAWEYIKRIGIVKKEIALKEFEVIILPRKFKKRQIRDSRTGRIVKWIK